MLVLWGLHAAIATGPSDHRLSRLTTLYDQVCLGAFPDDQAIDAAMKAQNARPLSTADVKITLRDDPGRAWELADGSATLWLELPPYHACSVRWSAPDMGDMTEYRAIADRFEAARGGFSPMAPYDTEYGELHVHAVGETRTLPDGSAESLFVFDQHITDPKKRRAGATGLSIRLVHQLAPPGSH